MLNTTKLLADVRASKKHYDTQLALLERKFEAEKEALKTPVREAVGAALEGGISQRQIHLNGTGFKDYRSHQKFMSGSGDPVNVVAEHPSIAGTVVPVEVDVEGMIIEETGQWAYRAYSGPNGYDFTLIDGELFIATDDMPVELTEAIREKNPNWFIEGVNY